jgi:predicted  nucleic acid-binding Zn-ribbon protein
MSDNPTRETHDARSFEERVFARFDALDARIDRIEVKVDALDARVSRIEAKVDALDGRLTTLEEKVDSRLRETRPIWEAMQADLTKVTGDVKEIKYTLKAMHKEMLRVHTEHEELDERVEKLESQRTP